MEMVSVTAHFLTTKLLFCHDMDLPHSLTITFSKVRNPNPASVGGNYALDFLTKEALFSQDSDFQQSLIEQKDLKQGHLKDASNFMIDLIKTKLQYKNFGVVFLFMLQIRNKIKVYLL